MMPLQAAAALWLWLGASTSTARNHIYIHIGTVPAYAAATQAKPQPANCKEGAAKFPANCNVATRRAP